MEQLLMYVQQGNAKGISSILDKQPFPSEVTKQNLVSHL